MSRREASSGAGSGAAEVRLPKPAAGGPGSVEDALRKRRSQREYSPRPLPLTAAAQLLWAAQGAASRRGGRTVPSAGALYPLEVYLVAGAVESLASGVHHYDPEEHALTFRKAGDLRSGLAAAALGQMWIADAAAVLLVAAVYERTTAKYGRRGQRYVHMEAGHAAQNVCLQAAALDVDTAVVGAFDDEEVARIAALPAGEAPLVLLPIGYR